MTTSGTAARDRALIHQAAAGLVPAHSEYPNKNRAWYALVGTNLYYVCDLVQGAFGNAGRNVDKDRRVLYELGFPVFALGYGDLMTKGHPAHRDV